MLSHEYSELDAYGYRPSIRVNMVIGNSAINAFVKATHHFRVTRTSLFHKLLLVKFYTVLKYIIHSRAQLNSHLKGELEI